MVLEAAGAAYLTELAPRDTELMTACLALQHVTKGKKQHC
jgi:hypothetical protein